MLQSFVLRDGNLNGRQVGALTYDSVAKQFSMTIAEDVPKDDLPLSLAGFANRNIRVLSHEDVLRWVRGRICPPGRHNIREILRDNGLKEYDEFGLLMVTQAKCDKDELYLDY
ncbi:MAG: hypothetical protein FWG53_11360 [Clostridiales bacterium]|nr:hypothetical protein [Clostridiales bacterium]